MIDPAKLRHLLLVLAPEGSSPMPEIRGEKIWLDGKLVDWDDARVHVLTHTLHYGVGVFAVSYTHLTLPTILRV